MSRERTLITGSSLTTLPAAASFIYIALADLVPSLHERPRVRDLRAQLVPILAGVGTIALVTGLS